MTSAVTMEDDSELSLVSTDTLTPSAYLEDDAQLVSTNELAHMATTPAAAESHSAEQSSEQGSESKPDISSTETEVAEDSSEAQDSNIDKEDTHESTSSPPHSHHHHLRLPDFKLPSISIPRHRSISTSSTKSADGETKIATLNLEWEAKIIEEFGFEAHEYLTSLLERTDLSINSSPSSSSTDACLRRWEAIHQGFSTQWKFNFLSLDSWGVAWRGKYLEPRPNPESVCGVALEIVDQDICWYHVFRNIRVAPGRYQLQWRFKYDCETKDKGPRIDQNFSFNTYVYDCPSSSPQEQEQQQSWNPTSTPKTLLSSINLPDLDGVLDDKPGFHTVAFAEFDVPSSGVRGREWRMLLVEVRETDFLFPKTEFALDQLTLKRIPETQQTASLPTPVDEEPAQGRSRSASKSWKSPPGWINSLVHKQGAFAEYEKQVNEVADALRKLVNSFAESSQIEEYGN